MPVTVAILAKDEADRIGDAIRSVPFADEVLVMESRSGDDTVEVAEALGARVVSTDWPGLMAQRNRALEEARHDWVFFLDADERVDAELAVAIAATVEEDGAVPGFLVMRHNTWLGHPVRGGTFGPRQHLRLMKREAARSELDGGHDLLVVEGEEGALPGRLVHHPYRDIGEHLDAIERYTTVFLNDSLESGRRASLTDVVFRPFLHFVKSYLLLAGFRDGVVGLQLAWLGSTHVALKWGRLYRAQRAQDGQ